MALPDEPTAPTWQECRVTGARRFSECPGVVAIHDRTAKPPYRLLYIRDGGTVTRPYNERRSLMRAYEVQKHKIEKGL